MIMHTHENNNCVIINMSCDEKLSNLNLKHSKFVSVALGWS